MGIAVLTNARVTGMESVEPLDLLTPRTLPLLQGRSLEGPIQRAFDGAVAQGLWLGSDARNKARLLSLDNPIGGRFLLEVPNDGMQGLADNLWVLFVRFRLGLTIFSSQQRCRHVNIATKKWCAAFLDGQGDHAATCESGGFVVARHAALRGPASTVVQAGRVLGFGGTDNTRVLGSC